MSSVMTTIGVTYDGMPVSFGGGVNSVAMLVRLIDDGWRGEIVFADTGCEWPETMCYMAYFERYLAQHGLSVTKIAPTEHRSARSYAANLIDYCERLAVIPLLGMRWCTTHWKIEPLANYLGSDTYLVGISADEAHRQPGKVRPLVDWCVDRKGCIAIIEAAGLDVPQKSGCYICPSQKDSQWRALWERHPELFERAARLEEMASEKHDKVATLDPHGKVTLRQRQYAYEHQLTLPELDMDELLAYRPCICGV